jgi:hypothetical protein
MNDSDVFQSNRIKVTFVFVFRSSWEFMSSGSQ